jgi:hypothetical protein
MKEKASGRRVRWPRARRALVVLALPLLAAWASAPASGQEAAASPTPAPCTRPEFRQFDFWIGAWDVAQPDGKLVGSNRIEKILGGCVLQESWRSTDGQSQGHSFNIYGRDGRWHQTWVDNQGLLLQLAGGLDAEGRMVMSQQLTRPRDGKRVLHEIAWTPLASGQVKQHWRVSEDAGKTWQDVFVGIYRRKEEK